MGCPQATQEALDMKRDQSFCDHDRNFDRAIQCIKHLKGDRGTLRKLGGGSVAECTKIAHRRSLAIFAADSGIAGNSTVGIKFVPFNRRENRRSQAIFFAEEIAHVGALKIARFCGGAVKIAAAAAENPAILVHSGL